METNLSTFYFENYVYNKIKATEELIQLTRRKLGAEKPKFWKLKQLQEYCKNLKDAREKINHLHWMVKEMDFISIAPAGN